MFREVLEHGISVRILVPADKEQIDELMNVLDLALPKLEIRGLDKSLQTQIGIIVIDINIAAHELRTPVQPILGLSQVLLTEKKGWERPELLRVINRNAERLQQLIENILDVTKIESQSLHLKMQRFNLNDLVSNIILEHKNQIERQQSDRKIILDSKDEIYMVGEKSRISQAISNLLGNAIKFTEEKGDIFRIERSLTLHNHIIHIFFFVLLISVERNKEADKNVVIVSVNDTGTGVDPEMVPRLFTKFASKSELGGTGLGLYISKSIIDAHSGRIWCENNSDGKGATFSFSLPLD